MPCVLAWRAQGAAAEEILCIGPWHSASPWAAKLACRAVTGSCSNAWHQPAVADILDQLTSVYCPMLYVCKRSPTGMLFGAGRLAGPGAGLPPGPPSPAQRSTAPAGWLGMCPHGSGVPTGTTCRGRRDMACTVQIMPAVAVEPKPQRAAVVIGHRGSMRILAIFSSSLWQIALSNLVPLAASVPRAPQRPPPSRPAMVSASKGPAALIAFFGLTCVSSMGTWAGTEGSF